MSNSLSDLFVAKKIMKQSKDPFEAAFEEQEESPPESPLGHMIVFNIFSYR